MNIENILNIVMSILSIVIPVWATVYTVNKRIKAQTHENHQPHLILEAIQRIDSINKYKYYLTFFGNNFYKLNKKLSNQEINQINGEDALNISLVLKNIGYGVATNIKFYNLEDSSQIYGNQEINDNIDQKLSTTFDIAMNEEKKVCAQIISRLVLDKDENKEDNIQFLCIYKDLNNFTSNFIITINIKNNHHYNYCTYQSSSLSYKKIINKNKCSYKKIIKKYNNL